MAFTRKWLESVGLSEAQVSAVMEEHVAVTDALKQQRDGFKSDAETAKQQLAALDGEKGYKEKYEQEHSAHEALKQKIADDAKAAKVKAAYRQMLTEEKIGHLDTVMKATDFSNMRLGEDGKLENEAELRKAALTEWADFKATVTERGATVPTPPSTSPAKMTREEIFKRENGRYVLSTEERQKAIAENPQAFQ